MFPLLLLYLVAVLVVILTRTYLAAVLVVVAAFLDEAVSSLGPLGSVLPGAFCSLGDPRERKWASAAQQQEAEQIRHWVATEKEAKARALQEQQLSLGGPPTVGMRAAPFSGVGPAALAFLTLRSAFSSKGWSCSWMRFWK